MKTKIVHIIILLAIIGVWSKVSAQSPCVNADFSLGNFTNWTGSVGQHTSAGDDYTAMVGMVLGTPNQSPYSAGQQTIMDTAGTDVNTNNMLNILPPNGANSCMLGNAQVESCDGSPYPQAARLAYTMPVDSSNTVFYCQYAVVLQNPNHTSPEQPKFTIRVLNAAGVSLDSIIYIAATGLPGFESCIPSASACASDSVLWQDWTTAVLNLSPYIGQVITIQITSLDCIPGAHFGYAYISCYCGTSNCLADFTSFKDSTSSHTINFTNYSSPNMNSWYWTFGDSTSSALQNPVHTYAADGTYPVCLTASDLDSNGTIICSNTYCAYVVAGNPPIPCQASFGYDTTSTNTIDFYNYSSTNTNTWYWSFGDSTYSTLQNPVHTYSTNGSYYVCLTASDLDSNGTVICSDTYCSYIYVGNTPTGCQASFGYDTTSTNVIDFYDYSSGNINSWYWSFGDSTYSTLQNPVHTYSTSGTYYVCLTASDIDSNGYVICSDTYCSYVYLGNSPTGCQASFGYDTTSTNVIDYYDYSSGNINSWYWSFGDSTYSTLQNPAHTYSTNGTYYVCLTASDIDSFGDVICSSTYCSYVVVGNIPRSCSAQFTIYPDSTTLYHYIAVNMATGIQPLIYLWSWGDGTYDSTPYPSHTYSAAGNFIVCLSITDSIGCTSSYCDSVNSVIAINVTKPGLFRNKRYNK